MPPSPYPSPQGERFYRLLPHPSGERTEVRGKAVDNKKRYDF